MSTGPGPITTRRRFLIGAGAAMGAVVLGACGGGKKTPADATGPATGAGTTAAERSLSGDLAIACMAASFENLVVATYQAGIGAAQAGRLGAVPPAVMTLLQTAAKHHSEHADAWNAVITGAGDTKVTDPDLVVKTTIDQGFGQVRDTNGFTRLVLQLEEQAAATYLSAIGVMENKQVIKTAASIQPVEMQHAAILNLVLGVYPVPNAFGTTVGARPATDCPRS